MTDKDMKKSEAETTELKDEQLDDVQGGFSHEVIQPRTVIDKGANQKGLLGDDLGILRGSKAEGGQDGEPKQTGDKIVASGGGNGI